MVTGTGFKNTRGLKILFQGGEFGEAVAFASYDSPSQLHFTSPDLTQFLKMPNHRNVRTVNVALSINDDLSTIYPIMYGIFTLTDPENTLCFGPGIIDNVPAGQRVEVCIVTVDQYGNLRSSPEIISS